MKSANASAASSSTSFASPRAMFMAAALVLAAPIFAPSSAFAADRCDPNASSAYRYDLAMNGGYAGGSTAPRGPACNTDPQPAASSSGYRYNGALNAGGYAGGSTVPRNWNPDGENAGSINAPVQP